MAYLAPTLLTAYHRRQQFTCRSDEQTQWLRRHALQATRTGTAKVLVVTESGQPSVAAYYAWTMAQLSLEAAPKRLKRGAGRYPQPVALLARLAVDSQHEGRGLGAGLVQDVLLRTAAISERIGCRALLVHAESDAARAFYQHLVPEFESSPTDPLHLVLLAKDIVRSIGGSG